MSKEKLPVSRRNLLSRINRVLAKQKRGKIVFQRTDLQGEGYYTRIDDKNNATGEKINLKALAKELEVLKPWETIE